MQNKFPVALLLLVLLVSLSANAYAKAWPGREERILGLGVKSTFPFDSFGDEVNTGLGVVGIVDYPLIPLIDLTAEVGYSHFAGESDRPSVDVWNICVGGRLALGVFFMGGETGYFSSVDEGSFIPSMGLRFGRFEGSVRHKAVGGSNWTSLRFGYYF
jgi:hypothetical protein